MTGYYVAFDADIEEYISTVDGMSDLGRAAVIDGVIEELSRDADAFLRRFPTGHEPLHFEYDYPQPDSDTLFVFDFIVDGTEMAVGVVTIKYVNHTVHRAGDPG